MPCRDSIAFELEAYLFRTQTLSEASALLDEAVLRLKLCQEWRLLSFRRGFLHPSSQGARYSCRLHLTVGRSLSPSSTVTNVIECIAPLLKSLRQHFLHYEVAAWLERLSVTPHSHRPQIDRVKPADLKNSLRKAS